MTPHSNNGVSFVHRPTPLTSHICWLGLAAVFLAQLQQGLFLGNLLVVAVGVFGLIGRVRIAPLVFLLLLAGNQITAGNWIGNFRLRGQFRPRWFDLGDLLLCVGALGYVAAHYRLQGMWYHALAADPRRRPHPPRRGLPSLGALVPFTDSERRRPEKNEPREISLLLLGLPIWAVLAQIIARQLAPNWQIFELPAWLARILIVVWALALGAFVTTNVLEIWKRRRMRRKAAAIYLQDVLWSETRGEQRRLERWRAWKRLMG